MYLAFLYILYILYIMFPFRFSSLSVSSVSHDSSVYYFLLSLDLLILLYFVQCIAFIFISAIMIVSSESLFLSVFSVLCFLFFDN